MFIKRFYVLIVGFYYLRSTIEFRILSFCFAILRNLLDIYSNCFANYFRIFCVDNYVFYKEEQFYFFLFSVYDILSSSCFIGSAMTPSILLNRNYQGRNRIVTHLKWKASSLSWLYILSVDFTKMPFFRLRKSLISSLLDILSCFS